MHVQMLAYNVCRSKKRGFSKGIWEAGGGSSQPEGKGSSPATKKAENATPSHAKQFEYLLIKWGPMAGNLGGRL